MDLVTKQSIHNQSLGLAAAYVRLYEQNNDQAQEILEAACDLRRTLPLENDGKRFGSKEFHLVTQSARIVRASV